MKLLFLKGFFIFFFCSAPMGPTMLNILTVCTDLGLGYPGDTMVYSLACMPWRGTLGTLGLHSILRGVLTCLFGPLQIWKATCLEHPESLNTYPTKRVSPSALFRTLHFKGLEANLAHIKCICSASTMSRRWLGWIHECTSQVKHMTKWSVGLRILQKPNFQRPHPGMR